MLSSDVVSALSDIDARTEEFRGLISSLDGDLVAVLRALGQLLYDDAVEVPRADLAMISFALGRGEASVHHTLRSQMIEGDEPVRLARLRGLAGELKGEGGLALAGSGGEQVDARL